MKPERLVMTAFGPYSKETVVDFAALEDRHLFLVTGPTGAGKTTILDGMVYALYGQTSGGMRDGETMRSDYASLDVKTEVEFVFSIGHDRYCVVRSPKQEVQKKRGEGTRILQASAALYEWNQTTNGSEDGEWVPVTVKHADLKNKIEDIIGFRIDQFLQVVLLPQGDFRKLLLASTSDREKILETLFHTEIYGRFQNILKRECDALGEQCRHIVEKEMGILELANVGSSEELGILIHEWDQKNQKLASLVKQAKSLRQTTNKGYEGYEELVKVETEIEKEGALVSALEEKEAYIEGLRREVKTLKAGRELASIGQQINETTEEKNNVLAVIKEVEDSIDTCTVMLGEWQIKWAEHEGLKSDYTEALEALQRHGVYKKTVEELAKEKVGEEQRSCQEKDVRKKVEKNAEKINDIQKVLAQKEDLRVIYSNWIAEHRDIDVLHLNLQHKLELRRKLDEERNHLDVLKRECVQLGSIVESLEKDVEQAKGAFIDAEIVRELQKAATLATHLIHGEPCPVCGSIEHPVIAKFSEEEDRGETYVEEKKKDYEHKKEALTKATTKWELSNANQIKAENEWSQKEAKESLSPVEMLQDELKQMVNLLDEKTTKEGALKKIEKEIQMEQTTLNSLQREGEESRHELIILERDGQNARNKIKELEDSLPIHIRTIEASNAIEEDAKKVVQAYEKAEEALNEQQKDIELKSVENTTRLSVNHNNLQEMDKKLSRLSELYNKEIKQLGIDEDEVHLIISKMSTLNDSEKAIKEYEAALLMLNTKIKQWKERKKSILSKDELDDLLEANKTEIRELLREIETICGNDISIEDIENEFVVNVEKNNSRSFWRDTVDTLYENLLKVESKYKTNASQLSEYDRALTDINEQNKTLQASFALVSKLSDLANGGQGGMMGFSFKRYVLAAILEEVTVAANIRLKEMSRRRYSLQRKEDVLSGRGLRGLDLEVYDSYTGYARPASTLSGGETFLASLSLALGLADVVQSYAGGVHLDAIFVDEGFGTLDPETLDIALDALTHLQESGRLVGIISHVPELKQRIDAHLVIDKADKGSTARFVLRNSFNSSSV